MHFNIALLWLAVIAPGSFANEDIHKYMSHEEVRQVFHTDHDSVPKYEVVKVHLSERLRKRAVLPAESKIHIRAFGDDISLWLYPRESVLIGENTPVYYTRPSSSMPEGVDFMLWDGLMKSFGEIYEDPRQLASLVINTDDSGKTTVNGHIASKKIAVRSLPSRVVEEYRRRRRSVDNSEDFPEVDSMYSIVFRTDEDYVENYPALPVNVTTLQTMGDGNFPPIPDTLYPEILVVVEYSMYRTFGDDNIYGLLEYLMAFWNGVDLKYRSLESPRIRFHIAGIVIGSYPDATPYISRNTMKAGVFNSTAAMPSAGEFFGAVRNSFPLDSYDVSVTLTKQTFGVGKDEGVVGKAYVATACHHVTFGTLCNIAMVRDDGTFGGVHVAAHELGHLFGARHDVEGGDCVTESGFIMAFTPYYTANTSDFSPCTTSAFDTYLKSHLLDCLFNQPAIHGKMFPKLLPGKVKSLEDQCKTQNLLAPCQKYANHNVCVNIYCADANGECRATGIGALDGTSCGGNRKFCLHMQCVSL